MPNSLGLVPGFLISLRLVRKYSEVVCLLPCRSPRAPFSGCELTRDPTVVVFCCYGVMRLVFGGRNSCWNMSGCGQICEHIKEVGREMADDKTSSPLCEGCSCFPLILFSISHFFSVAWKLLLHVQLKLLGPFGLTFADLQRERRRWKIRNKNRNKTWLSPAASHRRGSLWGTSGWWKELPCPQLPRTLRTHAPHRGALRPSKWKSGMISAIVGGCFSHCHPPLSVS